MLFRSFHHVIPLDDEGEGTISGKDDEISVQFPHKGYWRVKGSCVIKKTQNVLLIQNIKL